MSLTSKASTAVSWAEIRRPNLEKFQIKNTHRCLKEYELEVRKLIPGEAASPPLASLCCVTQANGFYLIPPVCLPLGHILLIY